MSRQQLPEQHAFDYDDTEEEEGRIPRRRSATDEALRERRRAAQGQGMRTTTRTACQTAAGGMPPFLRSDSEPMRYR
jgi:hypothetical protein